jgi:hypothetical protein
MNTEKECPTCELMNAEEADTCRHCGTAFFFELECLDPKFDDPADELRVVGVYKSVMDATLVKGFLEEHGIDACVPEELAPSLGMLESATVQVARKNVEAAKRILAENL